MRMRRELRAASLRRAALESNEMAVDKLAIDGEVAGGSSRRPIGYAGSSVGRRRQDRRNDESTKRRTTKGWQ